MARIRFFLSNVHCRYLTFPGSTEYQLAIGSRLTDVPATLAAVKLILSTLEAQIVCMAVGTPAWPVPARMPEMNMPHPDLVNVRSRRRVDASHV